MPDDNSPNYRICCISLYLDDIERLTAFVKQLRSRGHYAASKSSIIRLALDRLYADEADGQGPSDAELRDRWRRR